MFGRSLFLAVVLGGLLWGSRAAAHVINGGFETGDFTGWTVLGCAEVKTSGFGFTPTEGIYQALLLNHRHGFSGTSIDQLESFLGLPGGRLSSLGAGTATQGSAIKQTLNVMAGETISMQLAYVTAAYAKTEAYNDFAFVVVEGQHIQVVGDTFTDLVPGTAVFPRTTGYRTFEYTFAKSGLYNVSIGVVDVGDSDVVSGIIVDSVRSSR